MTKTALDGLAANAASAHLTEVERLQRLENIATSEALAATSTRADDAQYWHRFSLEARALLPNMTDEESRLREKMRMQKIQELQRPIGRIG